jgi:exodeoxyribonuclease V beta subunit
MTDTRELGLRIPVTGVQLIEASAGTGKTFTVATLYARLVIEQRLPVPCLLAVTYTEAAAKDLRDKLRERLASAAAMLDAGDAAVLATRDGERADAAATRTLLREALARGEAFPALRQRLRAAAAQMDLAPIHTIHGFCQRALREHALAAGQPLAPRTLLTNEASLRREVAVEFWRLRAADADAIGRLLALWNSPEKLAEALPELLGFDTLLPVPVAVDMRAARRRFADAFEAGGEDAHELLRAADERKEVSTTLAKPDVLDAVWGALHRWTNAPLDGDPRVPGLCNYGARVLATRKGRAKLAFKPDHPFYAAVDAFVDAQEAARVAAVHEVVAFARRRLAELKRERELIGFDDLIRDLADALEGPGGEALAQALRQQYAVALVDEFQDTDPRQWRIFRRLFAAPAPEDGERPRALFLIGDPKQAIYRFRGGDVATYLAAKWEAAAVHRLERNFRSRPLVLDAVAALFELGGGDAFQQPGIEFEPVQPGGACLDAHFQRAGADAPGLVVQMLEVPGKTNKDAARAQLAANCVAAIHALLAQAQAGGNQLALPQPDGTLLRRPVRPGDISVLVARNEDALLVQRQLSAAGIPSVSAGRATLYESEEVRDVRAFLAALLAPADDGRLRALLASPLFGLSAERIAAFGSDLFAHREWQDALQGWLAHAARRGAMAALAVVCAQQSARLLAQERGERRLSNYLQLVEELQGAEAAATGIAGLLAELERRVQDADERNDAEWLRLESDAACVRIMTMHVSKGLNLDLVFVPFAALKPGGGGANRSPRLARYHDGALGRVAKLVADGDDKACGLDADETFAEHLRVLYVALTRARFATWLGWGHEKDAADTPLGWLLHRDPVGTPPAKLDAAALDAGLRRLVERAGASVAIERATAPDRLAILPRLSFLDEKDLPAARTAARALDRDWWVYSFSQLAREDSGALAATGGAEDEAEPAPLARSRFSGTRFGNALHGALERVHFGTWRDWRGEPPPEGQLEALQEALRREGFASEADLDEGVPLLASLVSRTLNTPLPEGTVLATLPADALCVEMEFHFSLAPVAVPTLLALLHAHGVLTERRGFGARTRLEGLLTGRIDLVYASGGRYYVLDYKSNQLGDYGAESTARAVRESEYDLQYLLYTLALHRWLRFRLGAAYDMGTHLGGVRYVFCRGLDPDAGVDSPGVHALRLPDALVLALDDLLAGAAGQAAA